MSTGARINNYGSRIDHVLVADASGTGGISTYQRNSSSNDDRTYQCNSGGGGGSSRISQGSSAQAVARDAGDCRSPSNGTTLAAAATAATAAMDTAIAAVGSMGGVATAATASTAASDSEGRWDPVGAPSWCPPWVVGAVRGQCAEQIGGVRQAGLNYRYTSGHEAY